MRSPSPSITPEDVAGVVSDPQSAATVIAAIVTGIVTMIGWFVINHHTSKLHNKTQKALARTDDFGRYHTAITMLHGTNAGLADRALDILEQMIDSGKVDDEAKDLAIAALDAWTRPRTR